MKQTINRKLVQEYHMIDKDVSITGVRLLHKWNIDSIGILWEYDYEVPNLPFIVIATSHSVIETQLCLNPPSLYKALIISTAKKSQKCINN